MIKKTNRWISKYFLSYLPKKYWSKLVVKAFYTNQLENFSLKMNKIIRFKMEDVSYGRAY